MRRMSIPQKRKDLILLRYDDFPRCHVGNLTYKIIRNFWLTSPLKSMILEKLHEYNLFNNHLQ